MRWGPADLPVVAAPVRWLVVRAGELLVDSPGRIVISMALKGVGAVAGAG